MADPGLVARPFDEADAPAWDAFVRASRTPHFMLTRPYVEYHRDRFEDASLVVERAGELLGVLPASRARDEVTSHGGLTFGGLVLRERGSAAEALGVLEAIAASLRAAGVARLRYKAIPHIYHRAPAEEDLYALVRLGARLVRRDLSSSLRLDARPPVRKNRRQGRTRAQRAGLVLARDDAWAEFLEVEAEVLRRHGAVPVHSADELALLASRFPEEVVLWTARRDGRLLAGVVVYATPQVAHAQYIATTPEGRDVAALDGLVGHLLEHAYADRAWWDFGISTEEEGRVLNEGLVAHKESWGARGVVYDHYALDL